MDKKFGRSVQPSSKGPNFEKRNQDSNNGKLWTRGGNRRETTSGSLSVKTESIRKALPHRFRSFDKRPRSRGHADAVARDEAPCLDENQTELGSVFQQGSKKQSLNHLLNFTYAPRNCEQRQSGSRSPYAKNGFHSTSKKSKFIKDHFLQANCQFIVNTTGDYKQYLKNPDTLVEWKFIEQINVQVSESPSCPICLYPPKAAKITRCGHIYCWCCILHYLSLSEKSDHKCPICYDKIFKEDLKSVVVMPHNTFNIGEIITFKLMRRSEEMLTPYPAAENIANKDSLLSFSGEQPHKIYCKLLLAQNSDILSILNRESEELQYQLEYEEESEKCFIEEAIVYLKERETRVIENMMLNIDMEKLLEDECFNESETVQNSPAESITKYVEERHDLRNIYFYQASDGQHIYIHSFNVRMLKHTYGSLEYAPNIITAKILAKEGDSITENHRKCYKYLAHLPITCPFETVEIELEFPVVSHETLEFFRGELEERKKKRLRKAKEEKWREKRITEEENIKLYKKYPATIIPLESQQQFPTFISEPATSYADDLSKCANSHNSLESSGPSFAKMAAATKTSSNPWPNLRSSTHSGITPTTSKFNHSIEISERRRHNSNYSNTDEQDYSDHDLAPEPRTTFGDAIAQALQKAACSDSSECASQNDKNTKKKKSKQRILMSNSLSYSGN